MCHDHKIRLVLKLAVYSFQAGMHSRADALAGGKKIFYNGNFSQHILVGVWQSVLRGKMEWFYITDGGQFGFPVIGSPEKEKIKYQYQNNEEEAISDQFLIHISLYTAKLRLKQPCPLRIAITTNILQQCCIVLVLP